MAALPRVRREGGEWHVSRGLAKNPEIPILGQGWGREPGVWLARVPALPGFGLFGHKW